MWDPSAWDVAAMVLGCVLGLAVFVDAFMTTLAVASSAGPLTSRVLARCWRLLLWLHRPDARSSFLGAGGTLLLILTVLVWVALLWASWGLVFLGSGAVINAETRAAAPPTDVAYYAAMTLFTIGTGDIVAATPGWRLVSVLAGFTGLFLVTLAITYLISVISALVARRALAIQIHALGRTADEIVSHGWTGSSFSGMYEQQLIVLTSTVAVSAEQHLAYPVLHYFHASRRALSAPVAIATLDEAMTVLRVGVAAPDRPDRNAVEPLRSAVERYLTTTTSIAWTPQVPEPPPPELDAVRQAGVPVVDPDEFAAQVAALSARRTSLHQLVRRDGWTWDATLTD